MIKHNYPKEIIEFMDNIFEIHKIRGTVGNVNGVYFHVRTNEQNHVLPHIHAKYGEYWISIEINSGKILDGNLPNKQQKKAVEWDRLDGKKASVICTYIEGLNFEKQDNYKDLMNKIIEYVVVFKNTFSKYI